jgi:hypothetical protein
METMMTTEFAVCKMDSEFTRHCDEYMDQSHRGEITLEEAHERIGKLTVVYLEGCREIVRISAKTVVDLAAIRRSTQGIDDAHGRR